MKRLKKSAYTVENTKIQPKALKCGGNPEAMVAIIEFLRSARGVQASNLQGPFGCISDRVGAFFRRFITSLLLGLLENCD